MSSEDVLLEIEGTTVKCRKQVLVSNSDYFKAMFEGSFVEKNKNCITLQDVDLRAMNIILILLWDETHYIEDEDVLMVLQTACMLQFDKIRNICVNLVVEIMSVRNCLKVWIITEQLDLKPLYLKAKMMALSEFMVIKDSDSILELSLQQLLNYLGNVNLKCDNELTVFQTAMMWWYENSHNSTENLLKLLSCINYKSLIPDHFKEILIYPTIANSDVENVLRCLYNIMNKIKTETFPEDVIDKALKLDQSKNRVNLTFPCILVNPETRVNKKAKMEFSDEEDSIKESEKILDKYQRKIRYETLDTSIQKELLLVYFDFKTDKFEPFFNLKEKLEGFKLAGYKEYIFMYGGEYTLGRGDWNKGFWAYDTIKERWQRKSTLPYPRRHFESCIINSTIFIVGGTGLYRVNQENIFWYNFKEDKWSKEKPLPVFDRQIKCCNFMDKLFLFSITNNCGYFLENMKNWITIPIIIDKKLLDDKLGFHTIFSYKNKLYIKGKKIIEFIMTHNQLLVASIKEVTNKSYCKIESVVCNNCVFTLYAYTTPFAASSSKNCTPTTYSFEKYNLDTGDIEFIFEDIKFIDVMQIPFVIKESLYMFPFSHHSLVEGNNLVNSFL